MVAAAADLDSAPVYQGKLGVSIRWEVLPSTRRVPGSKAAACPSASWGPLKRRILLFRGSQKVLQFQSLGTLLATLPL